EQLGKDFCWNCIGIILQTKMFVARIGTLDLKSINSVLKGAACKAILTIRQKNTLKRIPRGSRDVDEEPIARYRDHLTRHSPDCRLSGHDFLSLPPSSQRNSPAKTTSCGKSVVAYRAALAGWFVLPRAASRLVVRTFRAKSF